MSSYHNTSIYQESIKFYDAVAKICHKKQSEPLFFNLENQAIKLTTDIAFSIEKPTKEEQNEHLQADLQNFEKIKQLLDLAQHRKLISPKEISHLEEKIRIFKTEIEFFINSRPTVLILSSLMGQGHISASKAIKEGFEHRFGKDYNVVIIDFVEQIGTFFNKATLRTYEHSTKYVPNAYKLFFDSTDSRWPAQLLSLVNYPINGKKIEKLFKSYNPAITISTFPIWDYLASLVIKKLPNKRFISLVTDSISIHNVWTTGNPDYHIVANQETKESMLKLGVHEDRIKILGFPVKLSFMREGNRNEFLKSLKLNPKNHTILFLPTAEKPLSTIRKIKEINDNFPKANLLVVCGRNKELLPRLQKKKFNDNVRIIGWTNQLPDYMKNSDLVITKAGGATVMECIASKKPIIITQVIPGQEMGNAELIQMHNLGIVPKAQKMTLTESIEYIKKNKATIDRNLRKISNPEAALKVADFIHEQISK